MKKQAAVIQFFIGISSIMQPLLLKAMDEMYVPIMSTAQKQEAKKILINEVHNKLHTLKHAYKQCKFNACKQRKLQELQQASKDVANAFSMFTIGELAVGPLNHRKANKLLLYAAQKNNIAGVTAAIKLGADINTENRLGQNALMWATYYQNTPMIDLLTDQSLN